MSEIAVLIISLIAGAIGTVTWWMVRRLIRKIDELISSIEGLTLQASLQEERLKGINTTLNDHANRLNDHGKRIRGLELRQVKVQ